METDEALMQEFQAGSREAFEALFARYRDPFYGFFRRRLSAAARAEDLAQETFLAVLRGRDRYQPRAAIRTYLYCIAMNLLMAERRRAGRKAVLSLTVDPSAPNLEECTLLIQQALGKLDPTEREIVMLREYEQLTYAEIAHVLKMPVNTVRSRLFRARMALKAVLKPREAVSRKEAFDAH